MCYRQTKGELPPTITEQTSGSPDSSGGDLLIHPPLPQQDRLATSSHPPPVREAQTSLPPASHHCVSSAKEPPGPVGVGRPCSSHNPPPGNTPCGRSRCKACSALMTTDTFTSHCTGKTYIPRTAATCKSRDVVYLIQCRRCGLQYVGETEQALNERLNSHGSDINRKSKDKPVAVHFNLPGHCTADLQVMVIDQLRGDDTVLRKIRGEMDHHIRNSITRRSQSEIKL